MTDRGRQTQTDSPSLSSTMFSVSHLCPSHLSLHLSFPLPLPARYNMGLYTARTGDICRLPPPPLFRSDTYHAAFIVCLLVGIFHMLPRLWVHHAAALDRATFSPSASTMAFSTMAVFMANFWLGVSLSTCICLLYSRCISWLLLSCVMWRGISWLYHSLLTYVV